MSRVYVAGSARRHWRRLAAAAWRWRAAGWGLGAVGVAAAGVGVAVLVVDPVGRWPLGTGLAGVGAVLVVVAMWAWLHADTIAEQAPTVLPDLPVAAEPVGVHPVRWHIDDAPTVHVGPRRRR